LIELQAAIAVLVLGLMGLSGAMVLAMQNQASSRERLLVSRALSRRLEEIGETPLEQIAATYDGTRFYIPGVQRTNSIAPVGEIQVAVRDPRLVEVTITATWSGDNGAESLDLFQEFGK
jgi:hypothetical protein